MKTSDAVDQLFDAMAKAQAAFKPAKKDAVNPHFKSSYSTLTSVIEACHDGLTANKLFVAQEVTYSPSGVMVLTRVAHASGQWMEFGPLFMPSSKADAQGLGSSATYARRYSYAAAMGISSDEDDDANQASAPTQSQRVAAKIPPAAWHPVDGPPPPSDNDAPAPEAEPVRFYEPDGTHHDVPVVSFGKNKGTPINELSDKSLNWYVDAARANVNDPSKAKWAAKERVWLDGLVAELGRRLPR